MTDVTKSVRLEDLEVPSLDVPSNECPGGDMTHNFAPPEQPSVED